MPKAKIHIDPEIFNEIFLKEIFPDLNRYQIVFGGSSSGKSVSLAQFIVLDLLAGGRNYLCTRQIANTLRGSENLRKRPLLSVPSALEALNQRMGDCNEHAVLLAALARAAGIPAQVEAGLVYQRGRFYYHAWNVLYLGGWITADSVTGQLPADVTHLRLVRGTERQIDLVGLIGKVKIEVLSYSK